MQTSTLESLSEARSRLVGDLSTHVVAVHAGRHRFSGFFWAPDLVVTADEALPHGKTVHVHAAGGEPVEAEIGGRDATTDIALLRLPKPIGNAATLVDTVPATGASAYVIGANSAGVIAADGIIAHTGPAWRSMRGGQIDARIDLSMHMNDLAEGGLAVDAAGRAFGMAVFGPRRRVLTIPTATIQRVAARLQADGRVPRGHLGLGLKGMRLDNGGFGLLVSNVLEGGPGAKAGLFQGDILLSFDGTPIRSVRDVALALGPDSIGQQMRFMIRRGGSDSEGVVTVEERPVP